VVQLTGREYFIIYGLLCCHIVIALGSSDFCQVVLHALWLTNDSIEHSAVYVQCDLCQVYFFSCLEFGDFVAGHTWMA
jgi:hypothetical protein